MKREAGYGTRWRNPRRVINSSSEHSEHNRSWYRNVGDLRSPFVSLEDWELFGTSGPVNFTFLGQGTCMAEAARLAEEQEKFAPVLAAIERGDAAAYRSLLESYNAHAGGSR